MGADGETLAATLPEEQASLIVEVFRMLADATRIQILWALTRGELSVNDLAERVAKPAPSVSQHLAKLKDEGIVRYRRDHRTLFYAIDHPAVMEIMAVLYTHFCGKDRT